MSSDAPETHNRILKATLLLLESGEGNAIRMSDVAKQAGITRQALYLHFNSRAELLIATTHYLDQLKGSAARLAASRSATTGPERLDAYIEAWGGYIPEIYGLAKALMAMSDSDAEAASAWNERMEDMREGCAAAINAIKRDKLLSPGLPASQATDLLWTILSVRNWELLTMERGWSQKKYIKTVKTMARRLFVVESNQDRNASR
jgi:AcrR family transcriptional regulator